MPAANSVIIPVQAQYLPAKGMTQLMKTISKVKQQNNPQLKVEGILIRLVDSRTNLAKKTTEMLRQNYGRSLHNYDVEIPIAVTAAETTVLGKSIYAYDENGTVAKAYT